MIIEFTESAWADLEYWMDHDQEVLQRFRELIAAIQRTPFSGLGKPEPLKYDLKGFWSRRITAEHRLVYRIDGRKGIDQTCSIIQCRFHY